MARTGADNMFCSLGVITTDVIHLSEINKQFGYISGNRRLMEVAELLKSLFPNYRIYRYDEDEMLVLCINIKRQEMEQQVENLQKRLAGQLWRGDGIQLECTSADTQPDCRGRGSYEQR